MRSCHSLTITAAIRVSLFQQIPCAILCLLMLDGGRMGRVCGAASARLLGRHGAGHGQSPAGARRSRSALDSLGIPSVARRGDDVGEPQLTRRCSGPAWRRAADLGR